MKKKMRVLQRFPFLASHVRKVDEKLRVGEYILACKYTDADYRDRWFIGHVVAIIQYDNQRRVQILEDSSHYQYKCYKRITAEEGHYILNNCPED